MKKRGLGIWKRKNSWYLDFYVRGQRHTECLGKVSKTFAKEMAAKRRTELLEGRLKPKALDPPFEKFIDIYLRTVSINKASKSHDRDRTSAAHLKEFFNGKKVSEMNRMDIERYKRDRKAELLAKRPNASMASINRELALLSHAYNVARLPNPVKGVKRFEEFGRERFLDDEEEERLFETIERLYPELEPLFRVLISAGYRLGEVLALVNDPEMVNFKEGYIKIPRIIRKGKKKDVLTPLNDALTQAIGKAIRSTGVPKGQRIFPYSIHSIEKKWKRIRKEADLEDAVRIHDLRHTFGSRAGSKAHDDPYAVQDLMGHTDFRTTQKYVHVSMARKQAVMRRMDRSPNKIHDIKEVAAR